MATFGVMTGGGDCPGLNAVIRAVVRRGLASGHRFVGFQGGWLGVINNEAIELNRENTAGLVTRGGTILGTSRTDPLAAGRQALDAMRATLDRHGITATVVIGGDGTLNAALDVSDLGIPLVGVPKTIDNDVPGTDFTIGFHTAVQTATDAIDRLHTTAESHNRVMVVEVMGRHTGWIAVSAGMASGADMILLPEHPFEIEAVCEHLRRRHASSRNFSIVVVAEGASPRLDLPSAGSNGPAPAGTAALSRARTVSPPVTSPTYAYARSTMPSQGAASYVREQIAERTGYDTRITVLGHVQRGGTPVAFDRMLATRFGVAAADAVCEGRLGTMVTLQARDVETIELARALSAPKLLDPHLYDVARVFFG